jgi:hypothetical protein
MSNDVLLESITRAIHKQDPTAQAFLFGSRARGDYKPDSDSCGPSWLTFLGHMKDSLWSLDLFRCESIALRTHWILVVMDQFTRRIIGFGIHAGNVDGIALCRMFNHAIFGQKAMPKYLSSDNDHFS